MSRFCVFVARFLHQRLSLGMGIERGTPLTAVEDARLLFYMLLTATVFAVLAMDDTVRSILAMELVGTAEHFAMAVSFLALMGGLGMLVVERMTAAAPTELVSRPEEE
jgi:hypothetical protein